MNRSVKDILDNSGENNFNLVRLIMAIAVLYSHSFVLFNTGGNHDVTRYAFRHFDSGSLGVSVFFLISGLLLSQSFFLTKSWKAFVTKRIFRIFPALIVCVTVTVFIVGALSTSKSTGDYYSSRDTYRYFYNILLDNERFIYDITGCFAGNKVPELVNGSLWTLPFEFICYILLFGLLTLLVFIKSGETLFNKTFIILLGLFVAVYLLNERYIIHRGYGLLTGFTYDIHAANNALRLFFFFFFGMALYFLRSLIRINGWVVIGAVAGLVLSQFINIAMISFFIESIAIALIILFIAGFKPLNRFNMKIDPSYGIYLYAWPVQQLVAYYFDLNSYISILITLPVTFLLGWLSFKFIEKPFLNFAKAHSFKSWYNNSKH